MQNFCYRVCRAPLGEIQTEKNYGKTSGRGDEVIMETLGGLSIFLRSVENLGDVLGL
jgi:hypothetical protein